MSGYREFAEQLVPLAQRLALVALALVGLFVLQIALLRVLREVRGRRQGRIRSSWEPALLSALDSPDPAALPRLGRREMPEFMYLLNHYHGILDGEVKERLNLLAERAGVPEAARRMLRSRSLRSRLLAVQTLGNVRDARAWDGIAALLRHRDAYLSLSAARALTRISPERAGPLLVPVLVGRADWSVPRASAVLEAVGPAHWSEGLAAALATAPPESHARLFRLLETADPAALPAVRRALDAAADPEAVAAGVAVLGRHCDPEDLPRVREALEHASVEVRMNAVQALGRMGTAGDEAALRARLSDADGGVRYAAASALAALFGMSHVRLQAITERTTDPYAVDALVQVIEEIRAL